MNDKNYIVVDGSNVAYLEQTQQGKPKVGNISAVDEALREKGFTPIIFVDARLRYDIDQPDQLEQLLVQQQIRQTPADTDGDYFVLEYAARYDAKIVSNDQFNEFREKFTWIDQRRVPVMIVNGDVEFYEPALEA